MGIFEISEQNFIWIFFFFALMKLMKILIIVVHDMEEKMFPESMSLLSADLHNRILRTVK